MEPAERGMATLAWGRLALGAASVLVPRTVIRSFGMRAEPALVYLTRTYGARAMALGTSWLLLRGEQRSLLTRLALAVDTSDTIAGLAQLRAGRGAPRRSAAALTALTGMYAGVGAARVLRTD